MAHSKIKKCTVFLFLTVFSIPVNAQKTNELGLVPLPNSISFLGNTHRIKQAYFILDEKNAFEIEVNWFKNELTKHKGIAIKPTKISDEKKHSIRLVLLDSKVMPDSAEYSIEISEKKIILSASHTLGMFYALQSLNQLFSSAKRNRIPCLSIQDKPNYTWRGMHLDVCRHFFSKEEVMKYIDYLAMYKMNVFHWHLTEDQGWRFESKKYPRLKEIGAYRNGSMVGAYKDNKVDSIRYGGFYTQNEMKEVVNYATQRHIVIVPELEMPGHALAALSSYPSFSCKGGSFEVGKKWGVFEDVFCAGNDSVFLFLENIIDELLEIFPGQYIHIGGDECPKTRWKSCSKCQKRMQEEKLNDEHELQSYFIQRIEKYVNSKGRKIIGWDEILEGGLAPNAAVMSWRGTEGGIAAARMAHNVVMTPGKPCYFDHYQHSPIEQEPHAIGGMNTLQDVYAYQATPKTWLDSDTSRFILGAQANVWTEYITTFEHVEYMALPRMSALAEALWTAPSKQNYSDFIVRLKKQRIMLDKLNVNYCKHFLSE